MSKIQKYKGDETQAVQGDVYIVQVEEKHTLDKIFKPLSDKGLIVAVGGTTGNRHVLVANQDSKVEVAQEEFGFFVRVLEGSACLTGHREHADITVKVAPKVLTEGVWWIGNQVEYDELEEIKKVID